MTTHDRNTGESTRGFLIDVEAPASKGRKAQTLRLPCTGFPPYTGREAIHVLQQYQRKGIACRAWTKTLGEWESLTLPEMLEVVI